MPTEPTSPSADATAQAVERLTWVKDGGATLYVDRADIGLVLAHLAALTVERDEARRERDRWRQETIDATADVELAGAGADILAAQRNAAQAALAAMTKERDAARGAMTAQDENHRQQLAELGLTERFPSLTHLADEMGEDLLQAEKERDRLREALREAISLTCQVVLDADLCGLPGVWRVRPKDGAWWTACAEHCDDRQAADWLARGIGAQKLAEVLGSLAPSPAAPVQPESHE